MRVRTNAFPNTFSRPKDFNVRMENAEAGTGYRTDSNNLVTWALNADNY
jgi:hypothetical protein